jgi:phage-related minor tail protein
VKDQIEGIKSAADLWEENTDRMQSATSNLFSDLITDGKNWEDHLLDFFSSVADSFAKMAADMAAQQIFSALGGTAGGGLDWGGILTGLFASAAGGAAGGSVGSFTGSPGSGGIAADGLYNHTFASGGWMPPNDVSLVGENGPELVMSSRAMRVFNNRDTEDFFGGRPSGVNVTQNFAVKDLDSFRAGSRIARREGRKVLGV